MNNTFYNLLNYYRSQSMAKKLVEKQIITQEESQHILEKLKQHYKIQEIIDGSYIFDL